MSTGTRFQTVQPADRDAGRVKASEVRTVILDVNVNVPQDMSPDDGMIIRLNNRIIKRLNYNEAQRLGLTTS